jgi:serine/threonine-protein kinase
MADVYLARRRVAGVEKRLVIKRLRRDRGRDPRFLDMFVREAQLSMSLVQQNIVPVFDFGRIGDDVFLAMEHIDGKDLGSTLARGRDLALGTESRGNAALSPMLAAFVAAECCQALDHAHRRNPPVIHRDVTTRNVLLSWAGEVKLADFGIAAVVGQVAGTFGTPGYMAPEQANGGTVDARSDVYALGIVLWEAVTGEHVRPATDRNLTLAAARSGELPAVSDKVPAGLATIIKRATELEPAARYATAHEMGEALDGFIVAERAREGGSAPAKRLADWLRTSWGDDFEDPSSAGAPNAADAIVTFLDDGADEVRGEHTQRSIAETVADEPAPASPPAASAQMPVAKPELPATQPTDVPASIELARQQPRRSRLPLTIVALAGIAAAVVIVWRVTQRPRAATPPPADAAVVVAPSDTAFVAVVDDAPMAAVDAELPADAAAVPIDAAPRVIVRPPVRVDAGAASAGSARLPTRMFTIGATPWAWVTVDDDPKQYETNPSITLPLALGKHRVTFSNPKLGVTRTIVIEVTADGENRHIEKMN